MVKEYITVYRSASEEIIEKKSRFIASVRPVETEEEAIDFINEVKSNYRDATHNVYAYYIEGDNSFQRYSDDGEPSGTAGLPVLEAIKKLGLRDVAVVVTRYFGGTLLGAAGLVRAYGKSASEGIKAAGIVKRVLCRTVRINMDYSLVGKVQSFLVSEGYIIVESRFLSEVTIDVLVNIDKIDYFMSEINEVTCARATVMLLEIGYVTIDIDGKRMSNFEN